MSLTKPLVSIIINVRNGEQYLLHAINSCLSQTYQNIEILVIDNFSTDKTSDIVHSITEPNLFYYKTPCSLSLGEARNFAISKSNGDFISFLDCDDLILPNKLDIQVPILLSNPLASVITSNSLFFNETSTRQLHTIFHPPKKQSVFQILRSYSISLETALIRKSYLTDYNIIFKSHLSFVEEYDLFLQLASVSQILDTPNILAMCRMHPSSLSNLEPHKFLEEKKNLLISYSLSPNKILSSSRFLSLFSSVITYESLVSSNTPIDRSFFSQSFQLLTSPLLFSKLVFRRLLNSLSHEF